LRGGAPDGIDLDTNIQFSQFSDGTYDLSTLLPVSSLPPIGDFNGDGTGDLVLHRINSKANLEFEGYLINNNQVSAANILGEVGTDWKVAGFGDFDGDRTTDMVLSRTNQKGNLEFEGYIINKNRISTASVLGEVGIEWQVAGFADLNGDGT